MRISELGEFPLISRLVGRVFSHCPTGYMGAGDDCAVLPLGAGRVQLVTTDLLVEKVHFLRERTSPSDLGYKSLAVNLSDIAAMGGKPTAFFLSLSLPKDLDVTWVDAFADGMNELAQQTKVPLLGGDTTGSSGPIVINIAVLGEASRRAIKMRSSAKPGDIVAVTGFLGDSGAGLRFVLEGFPRDVNSDALLLRHNRPHPHLAQGAWLASQKAVHAMMDLSDGVNSDICRILTASNVGVELELTKLPISVELQRSADTFGWDAQKMAAIGGEDYGLLLTVASEKWEKVREDFCKKFNTPFHAIGKIVSAGAGLQFVRNGVPVQFGGTGFQHF